MNPETRGAPSKKCAAGCMLRATVVCRGVGSHHQPAARPVLSLYGPWCHLERPPLLGVRKEEVHGGGCAQNEDDLAASEGKREQTGKRRVQRSLTARRRSWRVGTCSPEWSSRLTEEVEERPAEIPPSIIAHKTSSSRALGLSSWVPQLRGLRRLKTRPTVPPRFDGTAATSCLGFVDSDRDAIIM